MEKKDQLKITADKISKGLGTDVKQHTLEVLPNGIKSISINLTGAEIKVMQFPDGNIAITANMGLEAQHADRLNKFVKDLLDG